MKTILRLFCVIIVFSLGLFTAHAAKPNKDQCRALSVEYGGDVSFNYDKPGPGKVTVTISNFYVDCIHKDGTPQRVEVEGITNLVLSQEEVSDIIKDYALKQGLAKLKSEYCPTHGCNK